MNKWYERKRKELKEQLPFIFADDEKHGQNFWYIEDLDEFHKVILEIYSERLDDNYYEEDVPVFTKDSDVVAIWDFLQSRCDYEYEDLQIIQPVNKKEK